MSWIIDAALALLGIGFTLSILLNIGLTGLVKDQNRKFNLLLSNYKADLEMVLLHAHNFDEFIKQTQEAMKQEEEGRVDPEKTVYLQ